MAKKKRNDARGYQTTASQQPRQSSRQQSTRPNATTTTSLSSSQQQRPHHDGIHHVRVTLSRQEKLEHLLKLLLEFETYAKETWTDSTTSPSSSNHSPPAPIMTERKMASLHDRLDHIGISFPQMQRVVTALAPNTITLEVALDWLCLHISTRELPPILTEGLVRDELVSVQASSTSELQVVRAKNANISSRSSSFGPKENELDANVLTVQPKSVSPPTDDDDAAGDDEQQPAWVLAQYAFVDDDSIDDEDDQEIRDATATSVESSAPEKVDEKADTNSLKEPGDKQASESADPDHLQLQELRQQLAQAQFDVKDEASNYMRSKAEIKELKSQVQRLQKMVNKLEARLVKKNASTVASSEVKREELLDQEMEEEFGSFGIFDEDAAAAPADVDTNRSSGENKAAKDRPIIIPDASIPKSWTGAVPEDILRDWCRKEKIKPPRFADQSVTLPLKPPLVVSEDKRLVANKVHTKHYLATKALYHLQPDRPLYSMLPPFYRDMWKDWLNNRQQEKTQARNIVSTERQARINDLMQLVQGNSLGVAQEPRHELADTEDDWVPTTWESIDDEKDDDADGAPRTTAAGKATSQRMREEYCKQTTSLQYKKLLQQRKELPMFGYRHEFLSTVRNNPVTVLHAETGSGKTTQCPQLILDEALLDNRADETFILCTQPRRIAAVSVAERVAEEMAESSIGRRVGYQIRLESRRSDETKLLFCTTGIVLRLLVDNPRLIGISHIVVDEVHERQWQIDFLLVALRNLVSGPRPDLKVILMSATLDAKLFCSYFGGAPLVSVPGRTFPVTSYNLEQLLEETGHVIEEDSRFANRSQRQSEVTTMHITTQGGEKRREVASLDSTFLDEISDDYPGYSLATRRSMDRVNESVLNYDLIEDVLRLLLFPDGKITHGLVAPDGVDISQGSILIFLPGLAEIVTLSDRLKGSRVFGTRRLDIIPLHSSLSSQDQRKAFQSPHDGRRKVIIATNIAETSVTIPDVVIVLDSGRVRELTTDQRTGTPRLVATWCSRASVRQRAGRAGRVQPGICLKLFSSKTEHYVMKERGEPELRRIPLDEVCLSILSIGTATQCRAFLGSTPQPPMDSAVQNAIESLKEVGAIILESTSHQGHSVEKEMLSPLGQLLARLPVHPRIGKMLVFGVLFQCIDPVSTIAACLSSSQTLFTSGVRSHSEARGVQTKFQVADSDFLTLCNVYNAYQEAQSNGDAFGFCRTNYLNMASLREVHDAKVHFLDLLSSLGLVERVQVGLQHRSLDRKKLNQSLYNKHGDNETVIHCIICSGMYPHVARLAQRTTPDGRLRLEHKTEDIEVHTSSVNSRLSAKQAPSLWMCFHEKFGTATRVSVSTTCFIDPVALLLFCSNLEVKHLERKVIADDWISLQMAAKTSVTFQELRRSLQDMLKAVIQAASRGESMDWTLREHMLPVIDGFVAMLD